MLPLILGKMNFKNDCHMKKIFKVLSIVACTSVFVACNKASENEVVDINESSNVRTVQFSAGEVTKTVFGTPSGTSLPTLWTDTKTVGISLNLAPVKQSSAPEVTNGGTNATFNVDIADDHSGDYTFYAVSPYSSVLGVQSAQSRVQVEIPTTQTPLANSVDESAQILVAQYAAGASFPTTSIALDFSHLTAYGKLSFSNLALAAGETISSISLTASENWAGRYYYYFDDYDTNSAGDVIANSASKTITLNTTSSSDIWFACAPVDLGGQTVKVVITTDKSTTYTKNITIPAGKTFASGKVNAFTVNMNGIAADSADEYELVTDVDDLTVGSEVIIAAQGATAYALSTTQNTSNRAATSVTKKNSDTVISGPSDAVQILTIADGNKPGTIAFDTGTGYLYAASSSGNQLKTQATLSDNSSWAITIDSGTGEASIVAQGTNTRNVMQYNPNSGNPIFNCYASASQTAVAIYKLPGTGTAVLPKVTLANDIAAVVDEDDIIITWTDPSDSNVDHYVVTCTSQSDQNVDPAEGGYIFENLANGSYTVSVTAIAADSATHRDSETWESSTLDVSVGGDTHYYTKVTSTAGITSGDYLIVYEKDKVAFNGGLATLDAASNTVTVSIDANDRIEATSTMNAAKFTIDVTAGTIKSASGKYIGVSSNSNGLKQTDNASTYTHTFVIDGSGNASITASFAGSTMSLRYNSAADQKRFRYYKNAGQQAIQLYKYN